MNFSRKICTQCEYCEMEDYDGQLYINCHRIYDYDEMNLFIYDEDNYYEDINGQFRRITNLTLIEQINIIDEEKETFKKNCPYITEHLISDKNIENNKRQ